MRYPVLPNCIFRETFDSLSSVAQNGGAVTGTPTISNGYTTTLANAQKISYPKMKGVLNNATKFVIDLDFTTGSDITSYTDLISEWDASGRLQYMVQIINGFLIAYVGAASNYGSFALATNTRYRLRFSYDGSQATNALKLVCYKDGAAQALTFSGTIPTSMPFDISYTLTLNGTTASSVHVAGIVVKEVAIYKGVTSSLEEALDIYQQDTISELDASKALVYLPLKSWYYKENGTQLVVDGDMELVGTSNFASGNGATLTKDTTNPHGGVRALRITGLNGANAASGNILTNGKRYRVTGWARSVEGTHDPRILVGGGSYDWTGTVSTSWQYFDFEKVANGASFYYLAFSSGGSSGAVEFDDVRVELMEARTDNIGSLGGYALLGDGSTTTSFPAFMPPHKVVFDGTDSVNFFTTLPSGVYTAVFVLSKPTSALQYLLDCRTAGGTGAIYYDSGDVWATSGPEYINGKLSSFLPLGTINTVIVPGITLDVKTKLNLLIENGSGYPFTGNLYRFALYGGTLSPLQVQILHNQLMKTINV